MAVALAVTVAASTGCTAASEDAPPAPSETSSVGFAATEAADLRLDLEQQFALHAHLLLEATRAEAESRNAIEAAVDRSARQAAATVAAAYDGATGRDFRRVWQRCGEGLMKYAGEPHAKRSSVQRAPTDVAGFFVEITDGAIERDGTTASVRDRTRELLRAAAAYREDNVDAAYTSERDALAGMIALARAVSAAVAEQAPQRFPGERSSGPVELPSALRQLLGEHTLLSATTMRRGATGAEDFDATAAALNGNTRDLVRAVESIYASDADAFDSAWRTRISRLADYTVAAVERPQRRARHRRLLRAADAQVAVVASASNDTIDRRQTTRSLREHTAALVAQLDAYADGDYRAAETRRLRAYRRAVTLADLLAEGFVAHRPQHFGSS